MTEKTTTRRLALLAGVTGWTLAAILPTVAMAGDGKRSINVDAALAVGTFKAIRGVSGAPDMSFTDDFGGFHHSKRPKDVSAGYRLAAVNLVRTHDSLGAADIDSASGPLPRLEGPGLGAGFADPKYLIFPNPDADPSDPKSYNFGPTDVLIGGIVKLDADVIFRLGRASDTTAGPPKDLAKYAEIIRHIVLHYNKGWANGFHYGIKYWEVWNEPDLGKIWWRGSPEEYYALYGVAAKAVKAADPQALVGGPTIALVNESTPYREGFLAYARQQKLPLDFFPWHYYSDANDPQDFVRISREIRAVLDRYGFTHTRSILDEWNMAFNPFGPGQPPAVRGAFAASAAIYMQDAPIDQAAYYRADDSFGADGKTPDKVGQALVAIGKMALTPVRLAATGGDLSGLAVQAGRSDDGKTIQVLISNYQIPADQIGPRKGPDVLAIPGLFTMALPSRRSVTYADNRGYALSIKGLQAGSRWTIERYRMSEVDDLRLVDSREASAPTVELSAELPPPGFELIVLRRR